MTMPFTLHFLDFDYSEDDEGTGTFDAMASAAPGQIQALHAEVVAVLAWAHANFPDACAAAEDGGLWQYDLQGLQEVGTPVALDFDAAARHLTATPGVPSARRWTVSLSVSGNAEFCAALSSAFGVE